MNITIPEALAREIAANPERFKPGTAVGRDVVVLARISGHGAGGHIGQVIDLFEGTSGRGVTVDAGTDNTFRQVQSALSWALVGSVEEPVVGPRPVEGDRVLVIEADLGSSYINGHVGTVSNVPWPSSCGHFHQPDDWSGTPGAILVDFDPAVPFSSSGATMSCRVTRWAILPPTVQPDPMTAEAFHSAAETAHVEKQWRVGTHNGRTLYIDNQVVGMLDTAELAARVVEAVNGPGAEIDRLNLLLAEKYEEDHTSNEARLNAHKAEVLRDLLDDLEMSGLGSDEVLDHLRGRIARAEGGGQDG